MNAALNGGDPRTYKKVQDDNEPSSTYQSALNTNVSPLNDGGSSTNDAVNSNTQQTNSSTSLSTTDDHGKTS